MPSGSHFLGRHTCTQTLAHVRKQAYPYIYHHLFRLVLIAEAGTTVCAKLFLDKRVFIRKFSSNILFAPLPQM